jgi:hypothetical protein
MDETVFFTPEIIPLFLSIPTVTPFAEIRIELSFSDIDDFAVVVAAAFKR